jgi:hypothetical protein
MPAPWPTSFPIPGSELVSAFRGDFNLIIEAILSAFLAATEPAQKYPGQFWIDSSATPKLLKQRNSTNTAWVIRAQLDVDYGGGLPLGGGTMVGPINMNGFGLSNLPLGSGNAPARYADLVPYARLDGSQAFTGIPSLPAVDPSLPDQAARKDYVDRKSTAGGAFSGQIVMATGPTNPLHLTRKQDLDGAIDSHTHSGAPGFGQKIRGDKIDSAASLVGDTLRSQGAGVSVWAPPLKIADGALALVLNTGSTIGQTVFDAAPYVPVTAVVAILHVTFTWAFDVAAAVSTWMQLKLYRYSSGAAFLYAPHSTAPGAGPNGTVSLQILVPMTERKFVWETIRQGISVTAPNVTANLIGYL